MNRDQIFNALGLSDTNPGVYAAGWLDGGGGTLQVENPATGDVIGEVVMASVDDYEKVITNSQEVFAEWRMVPAPKRGEYVRLLSNALRDNKDALGALVSLEMGKIAAEGGGEVQEMIDVGDFAVGLSRQLYGLTMGSERPRHRMYEQWHPLGPVGVITSFNFPTAVWAWNSFIAAVCGDTMIWKPSSQTPLTAVAVTKIAHEVMAGSGFEGVFNLVVGSGATVGDTLINDRRVPLISATGSCNMGEKVGTAVAKRLGRSLLELGGNNAIIALDDADLDLVTRGALFAAVGTAGQRCTSLRRLIVQRGVSDQIAKRLVESYSQVTIGDPLDPSTLMGPLINQSAVDTFAAAVGIAQEQGGEVLTGGATLDGAGYFVEPTIIKMPSDAEILAIETFAPILYLVEVDSLDEAIAIHNGVPQGLSSAIFTDSVKAAEKFLSPEGSDCGIANVNIGTSGAEIGGAFGGEKETGGGRESGSDSWKAYMRRQTVTVNYGDDLPLAQGIEFG
ncbi:MAG: aldehyde dehydrogenase family protein [Acidimicrobiia bacterium]|nr:aldehyde dehydrogenase family protein [Acidimicrobiia bacterium]NNK91615.1 aldehyde dehydrogenase family protein [Acidimicrobiia bacterium]